MLTHTFRSLRTCPRLVLSTAGASSAGTVFPRRRIASSSVSDGATEPAPPTEHSAPTLRETRRVVNGFWSSNGVVCDPSGEPYYDLTEGMFIGDIPPNATRDDLMQLMSGYGTVMPNPAFEPGRLWSLVYFRCPPMGTVAALVHATMKEPLKLHGQPLWLRPVREFARAQLRSDVVVVRQGLPRGVTIEALQGLFKDAPVLQITLHKHSRLPGVQRAFLRLRSEEDAVSLTESQGNSRSFELAGNKLELTRTRRWRVWSPVTFTTIRMRYPFKTDNATTYDFMKALKPFAPVKSVRIGRGPSGTPTGSVYVDFDTQEAAAAVLSQHQSQAIKVNGIVPFMEASVGLDKKQAKSSETYRALLKALNKEDRRRLSHLPRMEQELHSTVTQ